MEEVRIVRAIPANRINNLHYGSHRPIGIREEYAVYNTRDHNQEHTRKA